MVADSGRIFQNISAEARAKQPGGRQRNAPVKEISKHTAGGASAHPADRVPANVQPHGEGHEARGSPR